MLLIPIFAGGCTYVWRLLPVVTVAGCVRYMFCAVCAVRDLVGVCYISMAIIPVA
jgi:hypothetical protein